MGKRTATGITALAIVENWLIPNNAPAERNVKSISFLSGTKNFCFSFFNKISDSIKRKIATIANCKKEYTSTLPVGTYVLKSTWSNIVPPFASILPKSKTIVLGVIFPFVFLEEEASSTADTNKRSIPSHCSGSTFWLRMKIPDIVGTSKPAIPKSDSSNMEEPRIARSEQTEDMQIVIPVAQAMSQPRGESEAKSAKEKLKSKNKPANKAEAPIEIVLKQASPDISRGIPLLMAFVDIF